MYDVHVWKGLDSSSGALLAEEASVADRVAPLTSELDGTCVSINYPRWVALLQSHPYYDKLAQSTGVFTEIFTRNPTTLYESGNNPAIGSIGPDLEKSSELETKFLYSTGSAPSFSAPAESHQSGDHCSALTQTLSRIASSLKGTNSVLAQY